MLEALEKKSFFLTTRMLISVMSKKAIDVYGSYGVPKEKIFIDITHQIPITF